MKRYELGSTNEVPADYEGEQFFTVADLVANGDDETLLELAARGDEDAKNWCDRQPQIEHLAVRDFDAFVVLMDDIEEYLRGRADADQPSGSAPIPNEEMSLLVRLQAAKMKKGA